MVIGKIAPVGPPHVPHGTSIVKIFVGPGKKELAMHKDLLCAASKYFNAAFNHGFAEGEDGVLNLPDEEPGRFQLFYDWLYTGRVVEGPSMYMTEDTQLYSDEFWLEIYDMADRLMVPSLGEVALLRLRALFSDEIPLVPSRKFIAAVFERESESLTLLEKFLVHHVYFWAYRSHGVTDWSEVAASNDRFGRLIGQTFLSRLSNPTDCDVHPCEIWKHHVVVETCDELQAKAGNKKPVQGKLLKRAF
ncbi:hypothetical protein PV10_02874 [Exophiala mesophila]|uniref:BTB domain-containing protein n=1 Tax=Exophiala mesophila TaxID=212818 RepID=A0A0D1ZMJ0_EXOME|nr:uncharacterized protein PV10_02874 [Exophiala mesophila]KIV95194.1 hypothetical protein PV10_02874 [Exophiala mesophila]